MSADLEEQLQDVISMAQEVGADLERAGAAQGLGGQDAAGGDQRGILADQQGLRALVVACLLYTSQAKKLNTRGLVTAFQKLAELDGGKSDMMSSHPSSAKRAQHIEDRIAKAK